MSGLTQRFLYILLFISVMGSGKVSGQADTILATSFTKGRMLVSLNGLISSSTNNRTTQSDNADKVFSNYAFDARLMKLAGNNLGLGLAFGTERYSSVQIVKFETEVLLIGPWMSYYFTRDEQGGIFINAALQYANLFEHNEYISGAQSYNEYFSGQGFAGLFGFGYCYVINRTVGLELSMNYRHARFFGNLEDDLLNSSTFDSFNRIDLHFRFGFIVIFNRIRNE